MRAPPLAVSAVDYHTGGEPFRIVSGGVRPLRGRTMLEKRRDARRSLDHVRRLLVDEPRGHADMYGCFVTEPEDDRAALGVVFFHNEGYSTACGHGTIALVTWALDSGYVEAPPQGEVELAVDTPSGRVACLARRRDDGSVASVRFRNVPSFVLARDLRLPSSRGELMLDVAFGGAFYGSLDLRSLGLAVDAASLPALIALERELRPALEAAVAVVHPLQRELAGIYGVVFHQDEPGEGLVQRNVTVFADGAVDRSPCGSGTSARLALLHDEGALAGGRELEHLSIVGSRFRGRVAGEVDVAGRRAVVTEVEGSAHICARHDFLLDPDDPLGTGFLLR